MVELLWAIVGFVIPFILSWIFAKINPAKFVSWLSKMLAKVLKNEEARNKVENEIGRLLVELGNAIISITPDENEKN